MGTTSVNVLSSTVIPQDSWVVQSVDSEETGPVSGTGFDGLAQNAIDGDTSSVWQTVEPNPQDPQIPHPHFIEINMNNIYELEGFRYLPRQDDAAQNGRAIEYALYLSLDGVNWGEPVAVGLFPNSDAEQEVLFDKQITAQYLRFEAYSEVNRGPWASVAELNVVGRPFGGNYSPVAQILEPAQNTVVTVNGSINFSASASDSDGDTPLSYNWNFGGAGASDSSSLNPGMIQFTTPGTYEVTFTVSDSQGLTNQRPAKRIIKVVDGSDPKIPKSNWIVRFVDSEQIPVPSKGYSGWPAENVFDGDPATLWISQFDQYQPRPTHEIQIDLGDVYMLDAFRYLPRQDGVAGAEIKGYLLYVSIDGKDWGMPVAMGTFPDPVTTGFAEERIVFAPTPGQFVRIVAISNYGSTGNSAIAEFDLEGLPADCADPIVRLVSPDTNGVVMTSNLDVSLVACFNPTVHAGWGVAIDLDGARQNILSTAPYRLTLSGLLAGDYDIEAYVVDDLGNPVAGADTYDQVLNVGVGGAYGVAAGDSITHGYGDDIVTDDVSTDGRNANGGYEPILNDWLAANDGVSHTVVNEGVNGYTTIQWLELMPTVINRHPNADYFLLMLGTNDAGIGMSGADYKLYMQQLIDLIVGAGKEVYLAKIPYDNGGPGSSVVTYNTKIDELVAENSITVTPPDFYSHFLNNPGEMSDKLHPNGVGYQSMGALWCDAITGSTCQSPAP
jgi:lysophospholipase L1-like esterase